MIFGERGVDTDSADLEAHESYNVSVTTIVKIAHEHRFYRRIMRRKPYLSPKTIAKRKEWARNNVKRDWRDVVFTDECEAYAPQHILPTFHSGRQSLMVWGAISYYQKFPLLRLPLAPSTVKNGVRIKAESLNEFRYTEMVIKSLLGARVVSLGR
ncbi:hypothetical protein CNBC3570 [Cryptococcus deneoformans B-3501A]|uniref:hypothetical protein n=1 Tax=Cryptococcus deneoformans (strain B-3501A) TaxID=283643 RepID=UPI000042EF5B|nr:hypothetical protein CNBC3570 [Cryptococcus neoformans var. neoformans B-3501A]EAL22219.1 hypothetical protein CNBC3570 [Cryptococcus neoformans var. neoformans B-3501A]